jgi:hypothetical protein
LGKEVMNRRSFFKFLPIAPVALIAEGARASTADQAPNKSISPLQLIAYHEPVHQPGSFTNPVPDMSRVVSMSIGQDGELWIKSKNDNFWKKVLTS